MFEDILIEGRIAKGHRRGWATAVSFILEAGLVGVLILFPLVFTEALPTRELVTYLVAPPPPPPPPPPAVSEPARTPAKSVVSEISDSGSLRMPTRIPKRIEMIKDEEPPVVATAGVIGGVQGGVPGGQLGGVIGGIIRSTPIARPIAPAPKPVVPKRIRVSQGVTEGLLIHKIVPNYPPLARSARVQGSVLLTAVIGKDGRIENLQLKRGHPLLAPAAIDAVSQWRYKPYRLNGQPVEVETLITVNFSLAG